VIFEAENAIGLQAGFEVQLGGIFKVILQGSFP
jgi:hypothetical protein